MLTPAAPTARQIMLHLLTDRPERPTARTIAESVGVSFQSANETLRFLEFHGAIHSRPAPAIAWRRLAELMSMLRIGFIDPKRKFKIRFDLPQIGEWLEEHQIRHAFAFTTAANQWAYFEPDPTIHIIIDRNDLQRLGRLIKKKTPTAMADGRTIPIKNVNVFVDNLELLDTTNARNLNLTTRIQTWIDLRHFPHAGAHAAFFQQVIAEEYPEVLEV